MKFGRMIRNSVPVISIVEALTGEDLSWSSVWRRFAGDGGAATATAEEKAAAEKKAADDKAALEKMSPEERKVAEEKAVKAKEEADALAKKEKADKIKGKSLIGGGDGDLSKEGDDDDEGGTEEEKAAKAKADKEKKAKEAADEKDKGFKASDLTLPDKTLLDEEATERIAAFAREHGLSQKQAQAVLGRDSEFLSAMADQNVHDFKTKTDGWAKEIQKDPDFGGDNFKKSAELVKRLIQKYGTQEFMDELDSSGFGNHPGLFRVLAGAAQGLGEDGLVFGNSSPGKKLRTREQRFYGRDKPPEE